MKITVFEKVTGKVLRTVMCPVGMGNLQLQSEAEDFIEGGYDDQAYVIVGFQAVPIGTVAEEGGA